MYQLLIFLTSLLIPFTTLASEGGHGNEMAGMDMGNEKTTDWLSTTQWPVIGVFIAILIIGSFTLRYLLHKYQSVDLLDHWHLRAFVKSKWYPTVFQLPALVVFAVIAYFLFLGPSTYADNPGSILVWTFWWALLPFSFILVGRLWCAVCPFALISDFVQKHFGRRKKIPVWLGKYSLWIIDIIFIFITWFDRVFGMTEHPILTGVIFIGLFLGVVICGFLYEKRAFCRYICFLGNVAGNYSMVAPMELKPKSEEKCKSCKEKFCYFGRGKQAGCPFNQVIPTKDGNRFCAMCANCIKSCPHDNIALTLRPFGSDFWKRAFVRFEESFFAKLLVGIVIIQNIGMLSLWVTLSDFVRSITGITNEKILFTLIYFLTMSVPVLLMFISSFISAKAAKEKTIQNFARFGYAFIAVDLAGHLAHNLNHLIGEGLTVITAITGIFTGKVTELMDSAVLQYGTIKTLQYLILSIGVIGTVFITYKIAKRKATSTKQVALTMTPHLVLLLLLMLLNFFIFQLPMEHRSTISSQQTVQTIDDHNDEDVHNETVPTQSLEPVKTLTPEEKAAAPKISLNVATHDFGEITQYGGSVQTDFIVKNEGKTQLKIGTVTTSCSCTTAKIATTTVAPGDTTVLTVYFNPNFHAEPLDKFKKVVFIPSNDPENPEAQVSITVDILEGK